MRERLLSWHLGADRDHNAAVEWTELQIFADVAAVRVMFGKRAAAIRALIVFDLDGDGFVTVREVRQAIIMIDEPA